MIYLQVVEFSGPPKGGPQGTYLKQGGSSVLFFRSKEHHSDLTHVTPAEFAKDEASQGGRDVEKHSFTFGSLVHLPTTSLKRP